MMRLVLRIAGGGALVLHGLAHAVFMYRGSAGLQPTVAGAYAVVILYSFALVLLVAAGVGLAGARYLYPIRIRLLTTGVSASAVTLALAWQPDLWIGMAANIAIVAYLLLRRGAVSEAAVPERRVSAKVGQALALLFVGYVVAGVAFWPWHRSWGTSDADWHLTLPGDPQVRTPALELMHGISIDAPDWVVWAWLVQIGQDRAGFYSYERLERLVGAHIRNADVIRPEWQHRNEGDLIPATQQGYLGGLFGERPGWRVNDVQACRAIVLENWGAFVIVPDGPHKSRLLVRSRVGGPHTHVATGAISFLAFEFPHFIMERGMLRGIKRRAESPRGQIGASPCAATL